MRLNQTLQHLALLPSRRPLSRAARGVTDRPTVFFGPGVRRVRVPTDRLPGSRHSCCHLRYTHLSLYTTDSLKPNFTKESVSGRKEKDDLSLCVVSRRRLASRRSIALHHLQQCHAPRIRKRGHRRYRISFVGWRLPAADPGAHPWQYCRAGLPYSKCNGQYVM